MQRWWPWILVASLAACEDGEAPSSDREEARDLDASATVTCTSGADAATALGVRGVELWDAFEGTYTLPSSRFSRKGRLEQASFTITVARSMERVPGLDDCARVAVPVLVTVQSVDPALNESTLGVLRGSLFEAEVAFATAESQQAREPRVYGNLAFRRGQAPRLKLRTDDAATWNAPPLQEAP